MSIELSTNHQSRLCILKGNGALTAEDFLDSRDIIISSFVAPGYNQLADLSEVQHLRLQPVDRLKSLASTLLDKRGGVDQPKLAIIATTDMMFAMARMFSVYLSIESNGSKITGVFKSTQEALDFLNNPLTTS